MRCQRFGTAWQNAWSSPFGVARHALLAAKTTPDVPIVHDTVPSATIPLPTAAGLDRRRRPRCQFLRAIQARARLRKKDALSGSGSPRHLERVCARAQRHQASAATTFGARNRKLPFPTRRLVPPSWHRRGDIAASLWGAVPSRCAQMPRVHARASTATSVLETRGKRGFQSWRVRARAQVRVRAGPRKLRRCANRSKESLGEPLHRMHRAQRVHASVLRGRWLRYVRESPRRRWWRQPLQQWSSATSPRGSALPSLASDTKLDARPWHHPRSHLGGR